LIATTGDRVVMATDIQSLLAALFTTEGKQPAVVTSTSAPTASGRGAQAPPAPSSSQALNHYRRALDALNKGDWRTFGAEMDALHKALEATAPP
jgi:uncharacterized membrane protein (UPF0182 family)